MRAHNIEILAEAVLFKLYQHALKRQERLKINEICSLFSVQVPELFVEKALDDLENAGMIYVAYSMEVASVYEIERPGIKRVQEQLSMEGSNIAQLSKLGDDWLLEAERVESESHAQKQPKFTVFRDNLIVALYHKSNEEGFELYRLKELADENQLSYRNGWIFEVVTFLDGHGYALVQKVMGGEETCVAKINASGLEYAEELIDETEATAPSDSPETVPAPDAVDVWEPLPIDRSNPEYSAAVDAVEQAVKVIEGDNGYAATHPDERNHIVWCLKEGLAAVKERLPSYAQVRSMIVAPLRFLAKKFAETVMGESAKLALAKVGEWLAGLGF